MNLKKIIIKIKFDKIIYKLYIRTIQILLL